MNTWPDIPGIRVGRLSEPTTNVPARRVGRLSEPTTNVPANPRAAPPDSPDLTITIEPPDLASRLSPDIRRDVDAAWATLQRGNPRLFDGPILTVLDYDLGAPDRPPHIRCARATYRHLAAAGWVKTGARMLGVNGILTGRDPRNVPHALLARRGETTRVYPGMWEFAPAGGIDPALTAPDNTPPSSTSSDTAPARFGLEAIRAALLAEAEEELGLALDDHPMRPVALCEDLHAPSVDFIVHIDLGEIDPQTPPQRPDCWEYSQTRWLPLTDLATFPNLSLMTQALIRFLWP